jgi:hypothetical protein
MRRHPSLLLAAALLSAGGGMAAADEPAFLRCDILPESPGPYGDGTAAGELFGIYAAEINPEVLVYPEELYEREETPRQRGFDVEEAHVKGEGWFDAYATEGPGT